MRSLLVWAVFSLLLVLVLPGILLAEPEPSDETPVKILGFTDSEIGYPWLKISRPKARFYLYVPELGPRDIAPRTDEPQQSPAFALTVDKQEVDQEEVNQVSYDIPIEINKKVEHFLQFFQNRKEQFFARSLARSRKYLPMMREILRENDLPEDLAYVALVESGFNTHAYSKARAVGPWQFIYRTAKRYGLRVNSWVDERRDPEKSTIAAANYLKDLYKMFDSWYLAMAAYNAGERKVMTAIKRFETVDFWELARFRYLKRETKEYVPKIIAATIIAKDPEQYGFEEPKGIEPLAYEKVNVPPRTPLRAVAKATNSSYQEIKRLNPALRRGVTPPGREHYEIRIPPGTQTSFEKKFASVRRSTKPASYDQISSSRYRVRRGDTVISIARRAGVSSRALMQANGLRDARRLRAGKVIRIPLANSGSGSPVPIAKQAFSRYRVKSGDTPGRIAKRHGVSTQAIIQANGIRDARRLRAGKVIRIPLANSGSDSSVPSAGQVISRYRVKSGDTLGRIAKRHGVSTQAIIQANGIRDARRLRAGKVIRIPSANGESGPTKASIKQEEFKYRVKSGDTLGRIAKRHGVTVRLLMEANSIGNPNRLKLGKLLVIPSGAKEGQRPGELKYKVRPGDSLYMLSRRWGVTVDDIIAANRQVKVRRLRVGTTLTIPLGDS